MKKSQDILVGDQYALFKANGFTRGEVGNVEESFPAARTEQGMLFDIAPLERYDAKEAAGGDILMVQTDRGREVFVKDELGEHARMLEGWRREDAERTLGVVTRLVLEEANKKGTPIRTNGIVMSVGQELTSVDTEGKPSEHRARRLGSIAGMTLLRFSNDNQTGEIDFEHSRHVIAA
jgi:hypothetical protein